MGISIQQFVLLFPHLLALLFITLCFKWSAARETAGVHGYEAHILQEHQDMVPGHHLASKSQKCGRLLQFSFKSQISLLDAWCHLCYQSPFANHWLPIEFYSMRKSYVRLWLRTSFFKLFVSSSIYVYIVCFRYL